MKRIAVFTILIFQSIYSIGQNKNASFGLIGSIDYSSYDFRVTPFDHDYKSNYGCSLGFVFQYHLNGKIFVGSGLNYSTKGYEIKYNYVIMYPGDPAIPRQSELTVSYLSMPIMIGYQLVNFGKLKFSPSFGLNIGFQMNETENTIYEDNSEKQSELLTHDLNKMQLSLSLNLGFKYPLGDKFKIGIEPFIGKGLNKMNDDSMSSGQLSYGGILGLYYKF